MDRKLVYMAVGVGITVVFGMALVAGAYSHRFGNYAEFRESHVTKGGIGSSGQQGMHSSAWESGKRDHGNERRGIRVNRGNCIADECLVVEGLDYPAGMLSDVAKQALIRALDDEYKASATYQSVLQKLGSVRPFSMIIRAEEQHISSLKALFDKYGVTIPENSFSPTVSALETLQAACQVGVDAEIANAALYRDELLPAVKEYVDITSVFTNLMNASQNRHLPAFDRCN